VPEVAARRLEQGFAMVTVTSDLGALEQGANAALGQVRGEAGVAGRLY
jgi:hypothetical protein